MADEKYTLSDGTEIPDMVKESEATAMPYTTKINKDSVVLAKRFYAGAKKQAEDDAKIISCRMKDVDEGKTGLISSEEFHARLRNLRVHG